MPLVYSSKVEGIPVKGTEMGDVILSKRDAHTLEIVEIRDLVNRLKSLLAESSEMPFDTIEMNLISLIKPIEEFILEESQLGIANHGSLELLKITVEELCNISIILLEVFQRFIDLEIQRKCHTRAVEWSARSVAMRHRVQSFLKTFLEVDMNDSEIYLTDFNPLSIAKAYMNHAILAQYTDIEMTIGFLRQALAEVTHISINKFHDQMKTRADILSTVSEVQYLLGYFLERSVSPNPLEAGNFYSAAEETIKLHPFPDTVRKRISQLVLPTASLLKPKKAISANRFPGSNSHIRRPSHSLSPHFRNARLPSLKKRKSLMMLHNLKPREFLSNLSLWSNRKASNPVPRTTLSSSLKNEILDPITSANISLLNGRERVGSDGESPRSKLNLLPADYTDPIGGSQLYSQPQLIKVLELGGEEDMEKKHDGFSERIRSTYNELHIDDVVLLFSQIPPNRLLTIVRVSFEEMHKTLILSESSDGWFTLNKVELGHVVIPVNSLILQNSVVASDGTIIRLDRSRELQFRFIDRGGEFCLLPLSIEKKENYTSLPNYRIGNLKRSGMLEDKEYEYQEIRDDIFILFRTSFDRQHANRERAAKVIYYAWVCYKARALAFRRRQVLFYFVHRFQFAAAKCIIGYFKMYCSRKCARLKLELSQHTLQERWKNEEIQLEAVCVIIRNIRRFLFNSHAKKRFLFEKYLRLDQKSKYYGVAAVIVQRWWHIVYKQKLSWREEEFERQAQRLVEEEHHFKESKCTIIQKHWRGILATRYMRRMKEEKRQVQNKKQQALVGYVDIIYLLLREYSSRLQRQEREARYQATKERLVSEAIQRSLLDSIKQRAMAAVFERYNHLHNSAMSIQQRFRIYRAKCTFHTNLCIRAVEDARRISEELILFRATEKIQRFSRLTLLKFCQRKGRAREGRKIFSAIQLVQSVGRGFLSRQSLASQFYSPSPLSISSTNEMEVNKAETILRGFFRHCYSRYHLRLNQRLKDYENECRIIQLIKLEEKYEKAAIRIQTFLRHQMIRRQYMAWHHLRQEAIQRGILAVSILQRHYRNSLQIF